MIEVAVAVITDEQNRVLIARRKPGKVMAGCWEFPGGKIEPGENPEECLIREMKEEMDLKVVIGECIAEITYAYKWEDVHLIAYEAHIMEGDIKLLDHDAMAWASLQEMGRYGMTPADEPLIEDLKHWFQTGKQE